MTEEKGWICLHRKFIDWEWYDDANVMRVFIHLLLCANHKDNKWRGRLIKQGQLITSQPKLANSLKLSISQIRNSLNKLKSTGEIAVKPTSEYSIISIKNYDLYQENSRQNNAQTSFKRQSDDRRATTNNNDNNINSINSTSINISLSAKNEKPKITREEREILKSFSKKEGAKNINAYIRKLIDTGDYLNILEEEKKKLAKRKAQQALLKEQQKTEEKEPQMTEETEEEIQQALERARELAGINNKRRS